MTISNIKEPKPQNPKPKTTNTIYEMDIFEVSVYLLTLIHHLKLKLTAKGIGLFWLLHDSCAANMSPKILHIKENTFISYPLTY